MQRPASVRCLFVEAWSNVAVMKKAEFVRLARMGAKERLADIQRELDAIYERFPDLRPRRAWRPGNPYTAAVRSAVSGVGPAVQGAVTRRRARLASQPRPDTGEPQTMQRARRKARAVKK